MRALIVIYVAAGALACVEIGWIRRKTVDGNQQIAMSRDEEVKLARELQDLYPNRAVQLHWQARRAIAFGDYTDAKKILKRGLLNAVQHEQMHFDLLRVLIAMDAPKNDIQAAVREFEYRFPGSKLDPMKQPLTSIHWITAQKAMKSGRFHDAAQAYETLRDQGIASGPVLYNLAVALAASDAAEADVDAAIAAWKESEPRTGLEDPRSLGAWLIQQQSRVGKSNHTR